MSEITKMKKKKADCRRDKTRVNLGKAFSRWRDIRAETVTDTDGDLAMFLLDFYEKVAASSTSAEKLPYAFPECLLSCEDASIKEEMDTKCASTCTSETKKCSVDGCVSWRRRAHCFNLPEDPQMRLQWVQFVTEANGQFSNSSCTGITICKEHFLELYFENHNETDGLKLKPSAVPSIVIKSEVNKLSLHQEEPVKSENSGQHGETVPRSTMNNKRCPLHGYTFQIPNGAGPLKCLCIEGITEANKQHQPGSIEVTLKPEQTEDHVRDSEALEGDISDEEEDGNDGDASSDEDWVPETLKIAEVRKKFSKDDREDEISLNGRKLKQLCTECGAFYYSVNHICEHNKPHVCTVCRKRFVTKISLKSHSSIHSASREHPCKYCYATFKTKPDKLAHQKTHQNQTEPYECPDCTETFASNEKRRTHLKKHGDPNEKKCDICGITFWQKQSLARHKLTHTGVKPYKCSVCERTLNQAGHLKSHMRVHTGEEPYQCQHCDESFKHKIQNMSGYLQHRNNISKHEHQSGCIEVTLEFEQTEDHGSDSGALAQSNEENNISDKDEDGDNGDASSDKDWVPRTRTTAEVKKTTSSSDEDSEGELLCTECGAFYYSPNHICEHKIKPYVCNMCGKRCDTELSLIIHNRKHYEDYEHSCKYCYATFKRKMNKHAHQKTHQNQTNPYKCPDCTETFASNEKRRRHLKKHGGPKERKCDICGITFWQKQSLARHKLTHTGVKPYKCSVCERTFNQAGHLKSHMSVHTGEKPYQCQHCDESFKHNGSLKSHIQRHHSLDVGDKMDKRDDGLSDTHEAQEHSETRADC